MLERYNVLLGEPFPLVVWFGTDEDLVKAVDAAIARGEPWDEASLLEWQGYEAPPADAVI